MKIIIIAQLLTGTKTVCVKCIVKDLNSLKNQIIKINLKGYNKLVLLTWNAQIKLFQCKIAVTGI